MKNICFILILTILCTCLPASAGASDEGGVGGFDGYLFTISEETELVMRLLSSDDVEGVCPEYGLYQTENIDNLTRLLSSGYIEYFEPNYYMWLLGEPNDELYSLQWGLEHIGASAAWDSGYDGQGVVVAIIDSGINSTHEDLVHANILEGYNIFDSSSDVTDNTGHGTHIAGIIAAKRNNGVGIAGITENVSIAPIKCFESQVTTSAYVIAALNVAVNTYNCDVINMSLGMNDNSLYLRQALQRAEDSNAIIISAVGNSGSDAIVYPAAFETVIGVGAVGRTGEVSAFSQTNSTVFVTAPGEDIVSAGHSSNSSYVYMVGTSQATPHVTAMAIIAKQYEPDITPAQFKEILIASSDDRGDPGYDFSYGYGVVNLEAFIDELQEYEFIADSGFFDIETHWAKEYIVYGVEKHLFTGVSPTHFEPENPTTRAMFTVVLWRYSGEVKTISNGFDDVYRSDWYYDAVNWGVNMGIVQGYGNGLFQPGLRITREQMVLMLYRYATVYGYVDEQADYSQALAGFTDTGDISTWAREATRWAVGEGIIQGMTATTIEPQTGTTRAQMAALIVRFVRWITD